MIIPSLILRILSLAFSGNAVDAPTFIVVTKEREGQITLTPPAGHHLNTKAPMSLEFTKQKKISSSKALPTLAEFKIPSTLHGAFRASAYVCDDANNYCVPKTVDGVFGNQSGHAQLSQSKESSDRIFKGLRDGFIFNQPEKALALASRLKKPLLIDFYGIWCPPCNVMDETVFKSSKFKKLAHKFILLKLDADSSVSWPLKAKFKIGGYPSFVFASSSGDEVSRVVGSRAIPVFLREMEQAWKWREVSIIQALSKAESGDAEAQYRLGIQALDRGEFAQADLWLSRTQATWKTLSPRFEKLYEAKLGAQADKDKEAQKNGKSVNPEPLEQLRIQALQSTSPGYFKMQTAIQIAESASESAKEKKNKYYQQALEIAQLLMDQPELLEEQEAEIQDILAMKADVHKELGQLEEAKKTFGQAALVYQKRISQLGKQGARERGWNLELGYCLRESGQLASAIALYERMIGLYPREFTFHFAYGRLLVAQKNWAQALVQTQMAYDYSYGDNRLRSAQSLAEIYQAQDKPLEAKKIIEETLATAEVPEDPTNRSLRYIEKLKEKLKKLSEVKT